MIYSFTGVSIKLANRNLGTLAFSKMRQDCPGLVEISHNSEHPVLHMKVDSGPMAAEVAIHVADRMFAVCGEPFHISDYDSQRIGGLKFPGAGKYRYDGHELVNLLMVECERFFGPSEFACFGCYHKDLPIFGIRATTFQRRRALMITCISFLNERFFQDSPIQIDVENSSMFTGTNLPFDYSSLPTTVEGPPNWDTSIDLDDYEDCMILDVWNGAKSASAAMSSDNYVRAKPYLQALKAAGVDVNHSMNGNLSGCRIILHGESSKVTAAVDHLASLHKTVKFRLPFSSEVGNDGYLSKENARKISVMLFDKFNHFCKRGGFEEWDNGTLWVTAYKCRAALAFNVHNLCSYMANYYRTAGIRHRSTQLDETAVYAAAGTAGVFILETIQHDGRIAVIYAGSPCETGRFLANK